MKITIPKRLLKKDIQQGLVGCGLWYFEILFGKKSHFMPFKIGKRRFSFVDFVYFNYDIHDSFNCRIRNRVKYLDLDIKHERESVYLQNTLLAPRRQSKVPYKSNWKKDWTP